MIATNAAAQGDAARHPKTEVSAMLLKAFAAGLLLTSISPVIAEEAKTVGVPAPANKVFRQPLPQPAPEYSVRPVNGVTPGRSAAEAKQALLQQKLRESEQLQNEIHQMQAELGLAQQFSVRVQMLEVSLTKLKKLKADFASEGGTETIAINDVAGLQKAITAGGITAPNQPVRAANANNENSFVEWLKQNNIAKELANPTVIVANGQPASLWSGGAVPVPASVDPAGAVEIRRTGTKMDLVVVARDNHRVRIEIRGSVRELDKAHAITGQWREGARHESSAIRYRRRRNDWPADYPRRTGLKKGSKGSSRRRVSTTKSTRLRSS